MKELATGSDTVNMGAEVKLPIDGTDTFYENQEAYPVKVQVSFRFGGPVVANVLTLKTFIGIGAVGAGQPREMTNLEDTVTSVVASGVPWQSQEVILGPLGDFDDRVRFSAISDEAGGADAAITVVSAIYDVNDIRSIGGSNASLTNDRLNVNSAEVGGDTPAVPPTNWSDMVISVAGRIKSGFTRLF